MKETDIINLPIVYNHTNITIGSLKITNIDFIKKIKEIYINLSKPSEYDEFEFYVASLDDNGDITFDGKLNRKKDRI